MPSGGGSGDRDGRVNPIVRSEGGASSGSASGDWRMSSSGLEGSSQAFGEANPLESFSACEGKLLPDMLCDHMEEGEPTTDAGIASCGTGIIRSPLDCSKKNMHGETIALMHGGMGTVDLHNAKNAEDETYLSLHVAEGVQAPLLSPPNDVCMGLNHDPGSGQSTPMSPCARTQGVWENDTLSWKHSAKVIDGAATSSNPWNIRNLEWKKSHVVPLPSSAELGHFSVEGTTALLDEEEVEATLKMFEYAIVGRMFGRRIPYSLLYSELSRRWTAMGRFQMIMLSWDCFVCVFETLEAREAIFLGGPWVILGQVLGIDRWSSSFSPANLDGFRTPVWIRMPSLPLYCWGSKNIARIVAHVGEPLWIDSATDQIDKGIFARTCVHIDLSKPLKPGVWVQGRHGKFFQKLEYEGLSVFCWRCCQVGHKAPACKLPSSGRGMAVAPQPSPSTHASPPLSLPREPPLNRVGEDCSAGLLTDEHRAGPWMMVHKKRRSHKSNQWSSYHQPTWNSAPKVKNKNSNGACMGVGSHGGRESHHDTMQNRRGKLGMPSPDASCYDMPHMLGETQVQDRGDMKHWNGSSLDSAGKHLDTHCVEVLQETNLKLAEPQMEEGQPDFTIMEEGHADFTNISAMPKDRNMEKMEEATHVEDGHVKEQQHFELGMEGMHLTFTGFSALSRGDVELASVSGTTKGRSRGGKTRGSKKEKMVCELGPVAPGTRKRRKVQTLTDGGDASPSPPP